MRRISFLLVAAGLGLAHVATPAGAVSGGRPAAIADTPFVAWLPEGCTGSLIAPDRVLTAGHCLQGYSPLGFSVLVGRDGDALVRSGDNFFAAAIANGGIPASGFAINPRFKESFPFAHRAPQNAIALNDVGLVLLSRPVTGIEPVRLPAASDRGVQRTGARGSILGYGLTTARPNSLPRSLLTGGMTVISPAACRRAYPHAIVASELCAQDRGRRVPLVQACLGDSGGPFIRRTAQGPVQIGITSWGPEVKDAKCGRRRLPGVYMRTAAFGSFIGEANPVIQPYPAAPLADVASEPKVTGTGRVGETLTCHPPQFAGSPSTLSYKWVLNFRTISRRPALRATRAMIGHSMGCSVTARNASGSFQAFPGRVNRVRVTG